MNIELYTVTHNRPGTGIITELFTDYDEAIALYHDKCKHLKDYGECNGEEKSDGRRVSHFYTTKDGYTFQLRGFAVLQKH